MSRTGKLLKNTVLFFVASFASKFLSVILVPIYVSYIATDDLGTTSLMLLFSGLFGIVFSLDVIDASYRFLLDEKEDKVKVVSNSVFAYLGGLLIFSLFYFSVLHNKLDTSKFWLLLNIVVCNFNLLIQQMSRGLKLNKTFAISGVCTSLIQGFTNIIMIVCFGIGGISIVIAPVVAAFFSIFYIGINARLWRYFSTRALSFDYIGRLINYGWPLCVGVVLNWIILNSGTYILSWTTGSTSQSGIFALAVKISSIIYMIMSVFNMAWQETSVEEFKSPNYIDYFNKVFNKYIVYIIYCVCFLTVGVSLYFNYGETGEYELSRYLIPVLLLGNSFYSMQNYLQTGFYLIKETRNVSKISFLCGSITLIIGLFVIPFYEIWGLVFTVFTGQLLLLLFTYKYVKKIIKYNFRLTPILYMSIGLLAFNTFAYYINNGIITIIVSLISFLVVTLLERDSIIRIANSFKIRYYINEQN